MAQHIQSGEDFTGSSPGNLVDDTRLDNAVNGAEILPGSISGRSQVTPATGDLLAFYDISGQLIGQNTLDTLVRLIALSDQVAATASMRTLGTASTAAAAGNDTRFVPTLTGVIKGAGAGSSWTTAVPSDYVLAPTVITLSVGAGSGNCALNTKFAVGLPNTTTACTVTLNNIPDGAKIYLKVVQGASSASTLTLVCNTGSPGTTLTQTRLGGAGVVTASTNAIDIIEIQRWGAAAHVVFLNAFA